MNYAEKFIVSPGSRVRLSAIDPSQTEAHQSHEKAAAEIQEQIERMDRLQYLLYADASQSLLIVMQGMDASGKDGAVGHLFSCMNPQGVTVTSFKEPSRVDLAHDFLWRVHSRAPGKGGIAVFNRSHYEDVLIVRVHNLVPRMVWSKRYALINDFERMLADNRTRILKFYLHISPDEQLARFKQRLDDPMRQWKISDSDYSERALWPNYVEAYEDALSLTSTEWAPWFVIPANHKWFRNLAISHIVADAMEGMGLQVPPPSVDLAETRRKYHAAREDGRGIRKTPPSHP
jgi:PPK2 family polyphosphate:nucleotide phosphotransferase